MNEQDIIIFLEKVGAIITASHIVYRSGKHGSVYVNKDAIYPHAVETSHLCRMIAERFVDEFVKNRIQVVIAPAIGGVILSYETARQLSEMTGCKVLSVYAEKSKNNGSFVIKRGYDKLIFGKNVLVVEDVVTTGGSVRKVIETTRAAGFSVRNHLGSGHLAVLLKQPQQVVCSASPHQIADIDILRHQKNLSIPARSRRTNGPRFDRSDAALLDLNRFASRVKLVADLTECHELTNPRHAKRSGFFCNFCGASATGRYNDTCPFAAPCVVFIPLSNCPSFSGPARIMDAKKIEHRTPCPAWSQDRSCLPSRALSRKAATAWSGTPSKTAEEGGTINQGRTLVLQNTLVDEVSHSAGRRYIK